jgi:glycosyltransferase involved in cell wall biosynthesis
LMEAFAIAYKRRKELALNIAGDGSQRQKIAALAKALDVARRYRYHGVYTHPEDCRTFMESLDVFVLPSFSEGTPNSIVEAMACGKPIIASDIGGIPDMIGDRAGILVPSGDIAALADAMIKLAENPDLRKSMGEAAQERYQKLFSPKVVVPMMLNTYQRVVNGGDHNKISGSTLSHIHPWSLQAPGSQVSP